MVLKPFLRDTILYVLSKAHTVPEVRSCTVLYCILYSTMLGWEFKV